MTGEQAVAYLRERWDAWQRLPARLDQLMSEGAHVLGLARAQGRTGTAERAEDVIQALGTLRGTVVAVSGKIEWVRQKLAAAGYGNELGIIPIVLAGFAIAAAAGMALVFKGISYNERVLRDIEKGILPPESLPGGGGGIGGAFGRGLGQALLPIAGIGALLFFASQQRRAR